MVDRHKLTVFYLKSFDMDSVQVGKMIQNLLLSEFMKVHYMMQ